MAAVDLGQLTNYLGSCRTARCLSHGKQIHQLLIKTGHAASLFVSNCLLQMYARCDPRLGDARKLFDQMLERNCFSWNSLVDAYLKSGCVTVALQLFDSMPRKNTFSWNAVVTGLVRSGNLENAKRLFEAMPLKDAVAVNAVLHGCIRQGQVGEAFRLFKHLASEFAAPLSPCNDSFVLATVVSACADEMAYDYGKQIHTRILVGNVELDSVLGSALVNMYVKCEDLGNASRVLSMFLEPDEYSLSALISGYAGCGRLTEARRTFEKKDRPGVVLWNSMINGYIYNDCRKEAFDLFNRMTREGVAPDSSTFASVLSVCASVCSHWNGKQIHSCGIKYGVVENNLVVSSALIVSYSKSGNWEDSCRVFGEIRVHDTIVLNSMINVYSNCGRIEEARHVFEMIPSKSTISWNSMIVGYSQNGRGVEALELFFRMRCLGLRLDEVSLASAVSACASMCALGTGEHLFALGTRIGLVNDLIVVSSLVELYCKCGKVSDGHKLFNSMHERDVALWNSMLMGYASNGYAIEVLELFETMINARVTANEVSFIAVLSACCHCGFVEEGLRWFHRMKGHYRIHPAVEHYSCVVDLLVRAGRLEEAVDFIESMPFKPDASMWTSVLGGCKARGNEILGSKVAERLIKLNPKQSGPYLQLSSIYAAHGEWQSSAQVRRMMHDRRIIKDAGCSWIDR